MSAAPDSALGDAEQIVCGGEEIGLLSPVGPGWNETARRCFLDAHRAGLRAAFASAAPTREGDPIVHIWLTGPAGVERWLDTTRDAFGAREWRQLANCERLTTVTPDSSQSGSTPVLECVEAVVEPPAPDAEAGARRRWGEVP